MRLIDADKLKQDHFIGDECETCINDAGRCQNWHVYTKMDFCGWIDDAPTVDAVEVVRCKDCKRWDDFPIASATPHTHECSASYPRRGTCADDYCSWGERKEDE